MRKKLLSKTYLRDVQKYDLSFYFDSNDYYLAIKKIIEATPFILPNKLCLINNNYYIAELVPKNENYTMRVFFNEHKERLLYYFDITNGNGLDMDTNIPYYDDLYTDIVITNNKVEVLDEDELLEALSQGSITQKDFNLANVTRDNLLKSISTKSNKYMKIDLERFLN